MTVLPYQLIVPRRRVLGSAWRFVTCVSLAITGLMAAAITWTPMPSASACSGATTASSGATCQNTGANAGATFGTMADFADFNDIPRVHDITTHTSGALHATKKTAVTRQSSTASGSYSTTAGATATGGLPCQESYMFVANISQWAVPPGCYANIYYPDRTAYHANSTFGYCNWWVEALHPNQPDILSGSEYVRTSTPVAGAAVWMNPNVQGASSAGHWAQAVAVSSDGYWVLITEMNFSWRGGGWGRVDFRYIHAGSGVYFIY